MDAYQVLGLAPTARLDQAEDAYRQLLRRYHPDLHQHEGPDALAAAERRTMALNAAIDQIRTSVTTTQGAIPSWDPYDDRPWDTAPAGAEDDPPAVACPLCGEWFHTSVSLKAHVAEHGLRLDKRRRRRRRLRPARPPLPLPLLIPLNGLGALMAATAGNALLHDVAISAWIFALAMAPSVIRVFTDDHG
jgi:hypothetical protein